jgi:hypothetical protein
MNRRIGKKKRRMTGNGDQKPQAANNAGNPSAQEKRGSADPSEQTAAPRGNVHSPEADRKCCKPDQGEKHWLDYATGIFAFVAAIGGALAAIAGFYQGWVARDTEIVSNGALVISNSMRFISYEPTTDPNRKWQISDVLTNVGNTPTRHLRFVPRLGVCFTGTAAQIDVNDTFPWRNTAKSAYSRNLIGPKSDIDGATIIFSNVKIACPIALTSRGVIKYEDIFGYPHITEFCHYIASIDDFKNFPAGQSVSAGARPCENEHNCVDEECGPDWKQRAKE